jgi:hypothetical protein
LFADFGGEAGDFADSSDHKKLRVVCVES